MLTLLVCGTEFLKHDEHIRTKFLNDIHREGIVAASFCSGFDNCTCISTGCSISCNSTGSTTYEFNNTFRYELPQIMEPEFETERERHWWVLHRNIPTKMAHPKKLVSFLISTNYLQRRFNFSKSGYLPKRIRAIRKSK